MFFISFCFQVLLMSANCMQLANMARSNSCTIVYFLSLKVNVKKCARVVFIHALVYPFVRLTLFV